MSCNNFRKLLLAFSLLLCANVSQASYTIVQHSTYNAASNNTAAFTSNQTAGNTNLVSVGFGPDPTFVSGTCGTSTITDNAGSAGGSGNNTYTMDQNVALTLQVVCVDIGRSFNITLTTGTNTATTNPSTNNSPVSFGIEVNGLGTSPTLESSGANSGVALGSVSTSGSCTVGDFAYSHFYSNAQPAAGSGWTTIGTPSSNQVAMWQQVASTGVVTATVTGAGSVTGGGVVCYKPTPASACTPSLSLMGVGAC